MLKPFGPILILFFVISFGNAQIRSDYDKEADFSKYRTYSFEGWEKNSDKILNDFDKKRITDALQNEFSLRGMQLVNSGGDAAITLFVVVNAKTSKTAYTDFNNYYGYGARWGWRYGMGAGSVSATTTISENDYNEGTFVVDMYDRETKRLIWQGIITAVVQENPSKREKAIPKKIGKLMKKYPVKPTKY
ncbi:protein of unknown function [Zhouia amylolytica]|uniref:DUF4136 domain-containing protein n=3 Tax=Zhouia amylolytica TaxID=376730 RepID=W2UJL6_9FLAO|nr:hypothetical protein P278_30020 [Zhouia amylolytica AD3]SFS39984.1 protein of unknown function [Zhouia amylolytica]